MKKTTSKDCFEKLPHELLVLIISHLKLKEAARTSVLSHTWRYLWKYTSGGLDFVRPFDSHDQSRVTELLTIKMRFIDWVNLVLDAHRGSNILKFTVRYNLDENNSNVINNWISFALQRHAKSLVLDFGPCKYTGICGDYILRRQLFSNSTASLIALHLVRVNFNAGDLDFIFSKFPMLRVLHIESIFFMKELKIVRPLPNLQRLTIRGCPFIRSLEVYAINLLSFVYRGPKIKLFFKVYPHLVDADIRGDILKTCHLSSYFSRLESLVLDLRDFSMFSSLLDFPKLLELRRLELYLSGDIFVIYLRRCAKLLEACPSLVRFGLKIYDLKVNSYSLNLLRGWTTRKHEHVKIMELVGFLGQEVDIMLVHNLLDMLPSLEKLYVDPRPISKHRGLGHGDFRQSVAAAQHLQYSLPPYTDLEIAFIHHDCFAYDCFHHNY